MHGTCLSKTHLNIAYEIILYNAHECIEFLLKKVTPCDHAIMTKSDKRIHFTFKKKGCFSRNVNVKKDRSVGMKFNSFVD